MEIVLGILLLFGVFTLGTVTTDDVRHETYTVESKSMGSEHPAEQSIDADQLAPCPVHGSTRPYRDLTDLPSQPVPQTTPDEADDTAEYSWDE